MNINIYDKELNRIGIVENKFVSCFWSEGYNTTEPFTLELQATEQYKKIVRPDNFVGRTDRKCLMVIKSVEAIDGKIIATGFQAQKMLDDVSFIGKISANSEVDKAIIQAYNDSSKCVSAKFAESNIGATYKEETENISIWQMIEIMCQSADVGIRSEKNGNSVLFSFYKPGKRENAIFSKQFGNADISSIMLAITNLKNYAIVIGSDLSDKTVRVDCDETNGEQRREIIVSGGVQKNGESNADYQKRLQALGHEELLKHNKIWEIRAIPTANDFGKKFDLGDIVTFLLPDYEMKFEARISRFQQKEQSNTTTTTIDIGEITIKR